MEPGSSQSTVLQPSDACPQNGAQHRNTQVSLGSFHIWPLLIPFGVVLGVAFQNISTMLFLVILEKRASRSLAKSGSFYLLFCAFFRVRFQRVVSTRFFSFPVFLGPWKEVFLVPF